MKSAAVLLANGFEEIEALATVDILRRAGIRCHTIAQSEPVVTGSHGIPVTADSLLENRDLREYDMVIFPGGMPGAANLRDDARVIRIAQAFDADPDKYVAAICAAPIILAKAGITKGRRVTSYPSDNFRALFSDADYVEEDLVVIDGHLVTSRGPASAFLFAFALVDLLGGNSEALKEDMLVNLAVKKIRS